MSSSTSQAAPAPAGNARRNLKTGEPLGTGGAWLTPRFRQGQVSSIQVTCPVHGLGEDESKCTRETSISVAGSQDMARRLLAVWLLWGFHSPNKEAHKRVWGDVLQAWRDGTLPSADEALELRALARAMDAPSRPPSAPSAKRARTTAAATAAAGQDEADEAVDLLGGRSGAPLGVHLQMLELAKQHLFPITNPAQRARQRIHADSSYGIPELWTEAFRYAYIHPNLPAPHGWMWKSSGGSFRLCPRGG